MPKFPRKLSADCPTTRTLNIDFPLNLKSPKLIAGWHSKDSNIYSHRSMWHVHVEPVKNDFRVLVLAIKLIAAAYFHGVHVCGSVDLPLVVYSKRFSTCERTLLDFVRQPCFREHNRFGAILLFCSLSFLFFTEFSLWNFLKSFHVKLLVHYNFISRSLSSSSLKTLLSISFILVIAVQLKTAQSQSVQYMTWTLKIFFFKLNSNANFIAICLISNRIQSSNHLSLGVVTFARFLIAFKIILVSISRKFFTKRFTQLKILSKQSL